MSVKGSRKQGLGQKRVRARVSKAVGVRVQEKEGGETAGRTGEGIRVQGTTGLLA